MADSSEKNFYDQNGMDGVVHSLPLYENFLEETAYLISVNRIKLKSYSPLCEELVTVDLENLGQFVHDMHGVLFTIQVTSWAFVSYALIWLCVTLYSRKSYIFKMENFIWSLFIINITFGCCFIFYGTEFYLTEKG